MTSLVAVTEERSLTPRELLVVRRCVRWFNERPHQVRVLHDILTHRAPTSLRLIDYYVTRYTKHNMVIVSDMNTAYDDYRRNLVSFSKKLFDPFARRNRMECVIMGEAVPTTAAQLNFVRWFLANNLFEKLVETKKDVERFMRAVKESSPSTGVFPKL